MSHDKTTRRTFFGRAGSVLAGSLLIPGLPGSALLRRLPAEARTAGRQGPKTSSLITIYLRGGADALNILIPWSDKMYYEVRPTIAIPEADLVKLNDDFGMHPALAPLKPFWDAQRLAFIPSAGSPHGTRSHFDAQDFMEYAAPGDRTVRDGWLNRYLRANHDAQNKSPLRALAMQGLLPRSLRGHEPVLAVPRLTRNRSEGLLDLFDDVYREGSGVGGLGLGGTEEMGGTSMEASRPASRDEVVEVGRETIETLRHFWDVTENAPGPAEGVKYPRDEFANRLALLAKVLKAGEPLEVAALDLPSWDHHQGEGSTDGAINARLGVLGASLAAFAQDLGPALDHTTILVMTEFGRTVRENGNRGTDHGRGSVMFALGGPVQGGVYGSYGNLEARFLVDGRDLNVEQDFRQVFSEALEGSFGFTPPKGFFPGWAASRDGIGFMRKG